MARALAIVMLVAGLAVGLSVWCEAATLYAADGSGGNLSNLVTLDQNTGAVVSTVGPIGFAVTGLAVHPGTGVLYGSTSAAAAAAAGALITINKTTGAGSLVGSFGVGTTLPDLTFTSDGTLYGWSRIEPNALVRVNLTTGQATRVGSFNIGLFFPGLGVAATTNGIVLGTLGRGPLFKVDPNTGVATAFTATNWPRPFSAFAALAFGPGGVLYGMAITGPTAGENDSYLVTIDLPGGNVTELGLTIPQGDALAFDPPVIPALTLPTAIPTLSELAFGAMALLLTSVAVYRIRRRHA